MIARDYIWDFWENVFGQDPYEGYREELHTLIVQTASAYLDEAEKEIPGGIEASGYVSYEDVQDAVLTAVEARVDKSIHDRITSALQAALSSLADEAEQLTNAPGAIEKVEVGGKRSTKVRITIREPFLKIWAMATEGYGYASWGGDERLSDLPRASSVANILDRLATVYGVAGLEQRFNYQLSSEWTPEVPPYSQILDLVNKAISGKKVPTSGWML